MATEQQVRDALKWQRDFCINDGAPATGAVCGALAERLDRESETGRRALDWPGEPIADALALRLAAPFHALYRSGRAPQLAPIYGGEISQAGDLIATTIAQHDGEISRWLDGPPQTNEPGRSAILMTGLLALADRHGLPFELLEIGSSAGLNLLIDRFRMDLGGVEVGPSDSPVLVEPEWRGAPPPDVPVSILSVRGVDIAPIDIRAPGAVERLLAYVWADQTRRVELLAKVLDLALTHPPKVEQGDAADWIEARLAEPQADGTCRVLVHSIMWQYLPRETRHRIEAAMAAAGEAATPSRPLGWVTYEGDRESRRPVLKVRSWPGHAEAEMLAHAQPHGLWIAPIE
ncbi:DUF2332 family protein [Sphingobium sp. Sx8-8]|uniref:DUF2332 domain-containing protein n=1 Tax=Sphingobium sp. Sx8-8 TaxID=2933617 RepID=UPI001F564526|nr:DUF2332 family protein [Sphingobium sp. Sx8-8]